MTPQWKDLDLNLSCVDFEDNYISKLTSYRHIKGAMFHLFLCQHQSGSWSIGLQTQWFGPGK